MKSMVDPIETVSYEDIDTCQGDGGEWQIKHDLDPVDNPDDWEIESEIDPDDDGEEWYLPRIDPWGRWRQNDVIDAGDTWLIIDGNGMTYGEPKRTRRIFKRRLPTRTQSV